MAREIKTEAELLAMVREEIGEPFLRISLFTDSAQGFYGVVYGTPNAVLQFQPRVDDACQKLSLLYEMKKTA